MSHSSLLYSSMVRQGLGKVNCLDVGLKCTFEPEPKDSVAGSGSLLFTIHTPSKINAPPRREIRRIGSSRMSGGHAGGDERLQIEQRADTRRRNDLERVVPEDVRDARAENAKEENCKPAEERQVCDLCRRTAKKKNGQLKSQPNPMTKKTMRVGE